MQRREIQVSLVLFLFVVSAFLRNQHTVGSDLTPSYLGCRVLADGNQGHLYAHDPAIFNRLRDPAWDRAEVEGGLGARYNTPPYVQTPLWTWSLKPLCTRTTYWQFARLFLALLLLCFAATIWLVARYWAPHLFRPDAIALLCLCLYATEAFQYSLHLLQTHILFVLCTVLALMLAGRSRPTSAGVLLAIAAAVKITPGLLLLYWIVRRQWRAAASFILCSLIIEAITIAAVGPGVYLDYVRELARTSRILLVSFNNQSLAAWWMGHDYTAAELFRWRDFPLPKALRAISLVLSFASALAGGVMDRRANHQEGIHAPIAPIGAIFAMIGTMVFAPIAWSHYAVILVIPVMVLFDVASRKNLRLPWRAALAAIAITAFVLNLYPLSYREILMHAYYSPAIFGHKQISLVRSQFYASILCLLGMALVAVCARDLPSKEKELGP